MLTIAQASSADDIAALQDLVREFTTWVISLDPGNENAPTFHNLEQEIATLPGDYAAPTGAFLLARKDGQPVGCVAFRDHSPDRVELKRMYVRPAARGQRIGEALVATLLAEVRARGKTGVVLDSFHTLTAAHHIYRAAGFRDVDAPEGFPEHLKPKVVFMELDPV